MNNKVAVITGSSTGLGLETAVLLAKNGYKVYATMRNLDKSVELQSRVDKDHKGNLVIKQLDVTDLNSINECFDSILESEEKIDVLINNAGAGFIRTTEQATDEEILWQINLNLLGVIRCTKAVLPCMRKNRDGHIINISSVGGLVGQPFNEIYCATKFGVEGYTESLASYVQPSFNIKFTAIEPGGISSEFAKSALSQFEHGGGMMDDEYKPILERYVSGAQGRTSTGVYQSSAEVAMVILDCIKMDDPPVRIRTSEWAEEFSSLKTSADPTGKLLQHEISKSLL